MVRGHVEIAGGGIAGLTAGMILARSGWTVRVHERSAEIREAGAGIYIRNNSIKVLEEFGLFAALAPAGTRIERTRMRDQHGRVMQDISNSAQSRLHVFARQSLIDVLADGARAAGVEIITNSPAIAAEPEGVLVLQDGKRLRADLVIAADGARSRVRDALSIGAVFRELDTLTNRHFIRGREITPEPVTTQHWSGHRRIGITPSGPDMTYAYTVCARHDTAAKALPLDVKAWAAAYPLLRRELEIMAASEVTQYPYVMVTCPTWHRDKVAIIGDAAHGLPPTLGQGAGLTIMNARALVTALDRSSNVRDALGLWEKEVRFISDATQTWSRRYDFLTRQWPSALNFIRPSIIWSLGHVPALNARMRIADRGLALTNLN
jgi:2-polyprenyl-6-methoxyphenol hydroxylase-like FAD-dependent oxidoreductase